MKKTKKARTAAPRKPAEVTIPVKLPKALWVELQPVLEARNLELDELVRLYARTLVTAQKAMQPLEPNDEMPLGKYRGELVSVVIRSDPKYVSWLLANVLSFKLAPASMLLLGGLGETGEIDELTEAEVALAEGVEECDGLEVHRDEWKTVESLMRKRPGVFEFMPPRGPGGAFRRLEKTEESR